MNLIDFQIAVTNEDDVTAHDLITEIDLKTESMVFNKAAEKFNFKIFQHRGKCYATLGGLASVFGYGSESGLRMLCQRHGFEGIPLSTFAQDVRKALADGKISNRELKGITREVFEDLNKKMQLLQALTELNQQHEAGDQ